MQNTYGTVSHRGSVWCVDGEPFVRARLKRVFPRVPQHAADTLKLSDSPENSRELAWFMVRYPMVISAADRALLDRLAALHVSAETRLAELMAGIVPPAEVVMAEPAREYQLFAGQMTVLRGGLLLADSVGLGKTVSTFVAMLLAKAFPAVIVAPAHLTRQWEKQLRRFLPALRVYRAKTGSPFDKDGKLVNMLGRRKRAPVGETQLDLLPESSLPDVVVISYHMLRGWAEFLAPLVKFVAYDECQQLRHDGTGIYTASDLVAGGASFRLGLSATPIYNYGGEFYNVLNVLMPDALGSKGEFHTEWCTSSGGNYLLKDSKLFGDYLRREGLMLLRTRKDVGRELPQLQKIIHEIDADQQPLNELGNSAVVLAKAMLRHNEQFKGERMRATGHFDALMRHATGIAKAPHVAEFMRILLDSGEKVVLFGWHRAVYDIWLRELAAYKPVLYTGTESGNQKSEAVEKFTKGDAQVLIMSLRSGAGVDGLQYACSTVVFGELDWSPGVHEQCIGRVDRDGQDTPCMAYFLVSESGADPIMSEVLGVKREQIEGVRNPDDTVLIERADVGENALRRLAREFLERRGESLPVAEEVQA